MSTLTLASSSSSSVPSSLSTSTHSSSSPIPPNYFTTYNSNFPMVNPNRQFTLFNWKIPPHLSNINLLLVAPLPQQPPPTPCSLILNSIQKFEMNIYSASFNPTFLVWLSSPPTNLSN